MFKLVSARPWLKRLLTGGLTAATLGPAAAVRPTQKTGPKDAVSSSRGSRTPPLWTDGGRQGFPLPMQIVLAEVRLTLMLVAGFTTLAIGLEKDAMSAERDVDAREDADDQARQADSRQPATAVRTGVLADKAATRERDVIDGR